MEGKSPMHFTSALRMSAILTDRTTPHRAHTVRKYEYLKALFIMLPT